MEHPNHINVSAEVPISSPHVLALLYQMHAEGKVFDIVLSAQSGMRPLGKVPFPMTSATISAMDFELTRKVTAQFLFPTDAIIFLTSLLDEDEALRAKMFF